MSRVTIKDGVAHMVLRGRGVSVRLDVTASGILAGEIRAVKSDALALAAAYQKLQHAETDIDRLEWMQFHGARVAWSKDGETCRVRWYDEQNECERQTAPCGDWRLALDLARYAK